MLPKWLENMPPGVAKNAQINRFYIRLACLYASESGRLYDLSELIGVSYTALKSQVLSIVRASDKTKNGIRKLLGEEFVPPDLPELRGRNRNS
jgi:hypothetical protein